MVRDGFLKNLLVAFRLIDLIVEKPNCVETTDGQGECFFNEEGFY